MYRPLRPVHRFMLFVIIAVTPALIYASCGSDPAVAKQPEPPKTEHQTTTTTTGPVTWPGVQIHTISKLNNMGDNNKTPNRIGYWWHGTIDGRECILVEDSGSPALTCNWNNQ